MAERWRRWWRRARRAVARPAASPARAALVALLVLGAIGLTAAGAGLPLAMRTRFQQSSSTLQQQLERAEREATNVFRQVAHSQLTQGVALALAAEHDITEPLSGAELWVEGVRVLPPRFTCRTAEPVPDDLALAAGRVVAAAQAKNPKALEPAVREWLAHRANNRVDPAADLLAGLDALEAAAQSGLVDAKLLRSLLVGGLDVGPSHVPALEQQALRALPSLCDDAVTERTARLLLMNGISAAPLLERLGSWRALRSEAPPNQAGRWAKGDDLLADVQPDARSVVVRTDTPMVGARLAVAAEGVSSDAALVGGGRWTPLDSSVVRPVALDELVASRARFNAMLRALTISTAALVAGATLLFLADRRRRQRTDTLRRDLVTAVAHELKTPLASMRLQADALERWIPGERAGKALGRLQEDVDALESLVENVLSYGRLARGGVLLREGEVSLLDLCRDALERAAREQPGVRIEISGEDVVVRADGELLRLVIGNLVRNAWRHNARHDKVVRVVVERTAGAARVLVSDNGVGIDLSERARIFRPFERSLTLARGSGLGLTLGREIAALHGGDVRLADSGPQGSTFVLELPV